MIDAISRTASAAVLAAETVHADVAHPTGRGRSNASSSRRASFGTIGVEPTTPAARASQSSGVRYHATVYGVASAGLNPAIARRKAIAPVSVSARKNTQPIITTTSAYAWRTGAARR